MELFIILSLFIGFVLLIQKPKKNREKSNNKNLNRRPNLSRPPNSMEFYRNFNSRDERIKYLNSFFEYYDYGFVYPEKHKKTSEPGTMEFLEETFIHGSNRYYSYHDEYIRIMKHYFFNKMDMISDVRQTEYYKKVKDKREFEKDHRELGNSILE